MPQRQVKITQTVGITTITKQHNCKECIYTHTQLAKYWYSLQVFPDRCYGRNVMAGDETPFHGGHLSKITQWTHGKIAHMQDFFKYLLARHCGKMWQSKLSRQIGKRDVATQADSIKNRYAHIYLLQFDFMVFKDGIKNISYFLFFSFFKGVYIHGQRVKKCKWIRHCNKLCSTAFCFAIVSRNYQTSGGTCLRLESRGSPRWPTGGCPGGTRAGFQPRWSCFAPLSPSPHPRWWPALRGEAT